jgi:hypothetical protein
MRAGANPRNTHLEQVICAQIMAPLVINTMRACVFQAIMFSSQQLKWAETSIILMRTSSTQCGSVSRVAHHQLNKHTCLSVCVGSYLCGGEVNEACEVFPLGRRQVFLLLKPPFQLIHLKQFEEKIPILIISYVKNDILVYKMEFDWQLFAHKKRLIKSFLEDAYSYFVNAQFSFWHFYAIFHQVKFTNYIQIKRLTVPKKSIGLLRPVIFIFNQS